MQKKIKELEKIDSDRIEFHKKLSKQIDDKDKELAAIQKKADCYEQNMNKLDELNKNHISKINDLEKKLNYNQIKEKKLFNAPTGPN